METIEHDTEALLVPAEPEVDMIRHSSQTKASSNEVLTTQQEGEEYENGNSKDLPMRGVPEKIDLSAEHLRQHEKTSEYRTEDLDLMMSNIDEYITLHAQCHPIDTRNEIERRKIPHSPPPSSFGSRKSFVTAYTAASSRASFLSARSNFDSRVSLSARYEPALAESVKIRNLDLSTRRTQESRTTTVYRDALIEKGLLLPEDTELNWSGKGQHVEYTRNDKIPLEVLSHLGSSISATVDKVLCRRIALARKTMRCTRSWDIRKALGEVEHLHRLRHAHIVQLVGSFLQGRNFSILIYPAADCHLGTFLEDTSDLEAAPSGRRYPELLGRKRFLAGAFSCLSTAIAYIHTHTTKHMDIKPANLLVRRTKHDNFTSFWHIYLADFGLSHSFKAQDHSQTDGPIARTPKYCAPEVYDYEPRGRSADIFSLGCVFLEIYTVLSRLSVQEFADFRREGSGDESFRANLDRIRVWVEIVADNMHSEVSELLLSMVVREPKKRPRANELVNFFLIRHEEHPSWFTFPCSHWRPESYEVYHPQEADDIL